MKKIIRIKTRETIALLLASTLWSGWAYAEGAQDTYRAGWNDRHEKRIERLTAEDGEH